MQKFGIFCTFALKYSIIMKKILTFVAALLLAVSATGKTTESDVIGKSNIKLSSRMMTPETLWAMGRIGGVEASPDGSRIVYQVGYYSVKQNKSHQVICIMNADGTGNQQLTASAKSETDPTWLDAQTIAFISGGEIWCMKADGSERRQLSKTDGNVEGFKFSPDRKQVIIIKSLPFHEVIKQNPDDLPKATGRRVTDLMYRHWDHYVESIQHPFVFSVGDGYAVATNGVDILEGEPYECPMEPFGGIEQLAWSPDSKTIAYTCRKKTGLEYSISTDSDIYLYNIGTRETKNLCKPADYVAPKVDPTITLATQAVNAKENLVNNVGYDQNPQFSPDGKYIAWQSMERDGYEADLNRLCICDLATGSKRYLNWQSDVEAFCWAPVSGKKVKAADPQFYFLSVWHGCCNMYVASQKGEVSQLTETWDDWTSIQMANNGQRILATRQSLSAPTDIYMVTPNAKGKKPAKGLVGITKTTISSRNSLSVRCSNTGYRRPTARRNSSGSCCLPTMRKARNTPPCSFAKVVHRVLYRSSGHTVGISRSWRPTAMSSWLQTVTVCLVSDRSGRKKSLAIGPVSVWTITSLPSILLLTHYPSSTATD